jgi:hypothetical protein
MAGDMCHPDPEPADLRDERAREPLMQGGFVHVPVHGPHRGSERLELLQDVGRDDVARMENQIRRAEELDARPGQPPPAARHVGVCDDGDAHR